MSYVQAYDRFILRKIMVQCGPFLKELPSSLDETFLVLIAATIDLHCPDMRTFITYTDKVAFNHCIVTYLQY